MGNCLGQDVTTKYAAGTDAPTIALNGEVAAAQEAVNLLTGSAAYSSWVQIHIECQNLRKSDALSKSDPMAVLYEERNGQWVEAGRTEVIANTHHPKFVKRVRLSFNFERVQRIRLLVVDVDKGVDPMRPGSEQQCDPLGSVELTVSEIVAAQGRTLSRPLANKGGKALTGSNGAISTVTFTAEEEANCKLLYRIRIKASGLRNVETFSKSDPFLRISRQQDDPSGGQPKWIPVIKTETRSNNLNPVWEPIAVKATTLNNGDVYRPLKLEVFDYETSGKHKLLGWADVTTEAMQQQAGKQALITLNSAPGRTGGAGTLDIVSFDAEHQPTFLDYIQGGMEVRFVVGLDFTASNGNPNDPSSKHYFGRGYTQYENAVMGVGQVIEFYDAGRLFPTFGFGGQALAPGSITSHCFPLNGDPYGICAGVPGILAAYRQALAQWRLAGPTLFAPIIRMAISFASQHLGASPPKYTCLLILTDGEIMDMDETIKAIIDASDLPISILIVGIGNDSFANMVRLDSDNKLLSHNGRTARRDIVQFVEFNRFAGNGPALAGELLAELPGQALTYFKQKGIPCPQPMGPPPPPPGSLPAPAAGPGAASIAYRGSLEGEAGASAPPPAAAVAGPPGYPPAP